MFLIDFCMSFDIHSNKPRDGNSGSSGSDMAMFQRPLRTKTWSFDSVRGISLKIAASFDLLRKGFGSFMLQKKQDGFVHCGSSNLSIFFDLPSCFFFLILKEKKRLN